jgi:uncharacterized membrane protein
MSTLVVLKLDSEDGAAQMRDRLLSLQKQQLIMIEDAGIMKKNADGKPNSRPGARLPPTRATHALTSRR